MEQSIINGSGLLTPDSAVNSGPLSVDVSTQDIAISITEKTQLLRKISSLEEELSKAEKQFQNKCKSIYSSSISIINVLLSSVSFS